MKPVKLGIIGCGIAARELHWPALQKLKDKFEIIAVCNHTEAKAKSYSELVGGAPYVLDYRALLHNPEVEAVDIILPIHLNFEVTRAALVAGKHVLVEKPLAAQLAQAKKLVADEKKFPQVKMVAENFRYRSTFFRVKTMLDSGAIGVPYFVFWNVCFKVDERNKYSHTDWRIHHQYPGGFLTDGGVHNIAALRFWFGDIIAGHAVTRSVNRAIGELDTMSLQFRTQTNVAGVLNLFFSADGHFENRIIILGATGSLIIESNTIRLKRTGADDLVETIADDGGYMAEFDDFYAAIRTGRQPVSTFSQAYRDLEIILTALKSATMDKKI